MNRKIYDNEYWYPGINLWWSNWEVDRKRTRFTQSNYSRLVNFKRVMNKGNKDTMLSRKRIHMKQDFLMKKSFIFTRLHGLYKLFPDRDFKYCEKPLHKAHPLILTKIKPSLSSICTIPIIYGYSYLLLDD